MLTRRRFLTIAAAATACPASVSADVSLWRGRALGADVTLKLAGAGGEASGRIWRKVARALRQIEGQFSLFADSDLTRLNAVGRLAFPSADMREILQLAGDVHRATGGVFDPTVQPLWQAMARGHKTDAARALTGWDKLTLTDDEIALRPGMALTLNGIAQGFATDRIAALMRGEGFDDVLIDAGEVMALGRKNARPWQAGIAGPDGHLLHRISLSECALATSSPMGTRIGRDAPHILHADGRAPYWNTVSVSARSAALADALSTAFCLMPRPEIERAVARFDDVKVEFLG